MGVARTALLGRNAVAERLRSLGCAVEDVTVPPRAHRLKVRVPGRGTVLTAVRSKTAGTWQTQASLGAPASPPQDVFWVFVDLGGQPVAFYVVPEWWILDDIHRDHQAHRPTRGQTRGEPVE
ncbi:MAG: hypothetical protein U0237_19805 [Thermoleophilia bacterium]